MRLIGTLTQPETLDTSGKTYLRQAVRGIARRQNQLLLVYSPQNGVYKFPGGGIEAGETQKEALVREVAEECGAHVTAIGQPYGKLVTYNPAKEAGFDVFKMESYYYLCEVGPDFGRQKLDAYEQALAFTPVWVEVDRAIRANRTVLQSPHLLSRAQSTKV